MSELTGTIRKTHVRLRLKHFSVYSFTVCQTSLSATQLVHNELDTKYRETVCFSYNIFTKTFSPTLRRHLSGDTAPYIPNSDTTILYTCFSDQYYNRIIPLVRRDSSVGIATRYGLDDPGIESRCGSRFSAPVQTGPWGPPSLLYKRRDLLKKHKNTRGEVPACVMKPEEVEVKPPPLHYSTNVRCVYSFTQTRVQR